MRNSGSLYLLGRSGIFPFHSHQAILCDSVLFEMIKNESPIPPTAEVVSYENLHELQVILFFVSFKSLQMTVLLLSVCHYLLVVQESWADLELWNFVKVAEMLKLGIPDLSLPPPSAPPGEDDISAEMEYTANTGICHSPLIS